MPQYAVSCATQCMQSGKHEKTSKTDVNVYSTKSVLLYMFDACCVRIETCRTGRINAQQLTFWQGVGTPGHCSIVSQRIDFYGP